MKNWGTYLGPSWELENLKEELGDYRTEEPGTQSKIPNSPQISGKVVNFSQIDND